MKTPQILTGQQAIDQYGLNALIECRVAIATELNGLGHSTMQIGAIADPDNCFIDLSDEPAVLYVEIEQDDDWILHPVMADEQFVLLDDKNQPASNELLARRIVELTETVTVLSNKLAAKPSDSGYATLLAERDLALAQVEQLRDAGNEVYAELQQWALSESHEETNRVFELWLKVRNKTPTQCLASRHPDDLAVDRFSEAMKAKLASARAKGRSGWDDKASCSGEHLAQLLIEHLTKGNAGTFEDVANFAMMLHQRGESPQLMAKCFAEHNARVIDSFDAFIEMVFPQEGVNFDTYAAALNMFREQLRQQAKGGE